MADNLSHVPVQALPQTVEEADLRLAQLSAYIRRHDLMGHADTVKSSLVQVDGLLERRAMLSLLRDGVSLC